MALKGMQLALLDDVIPYVLENPPLPGQLWVTSSGQARVTRLESVGQELLVWADYGSGIEQPHVREGVTCNLKLVLGGDADLEDEFTAKSQIDTPEVSSTPAVTRACGWIGWKETKRERKRRDPWVGRQPWLYWEEPGGKKRSRYIPKAKLAAVEESVYGLRRPIYETLKLLEKK